ncbi:hypothetical protein OEA41_007507 [Lepraria neglecta]|uniref:Uncharacterized protein n=1 Tax=Lepraria neglecta TaxID=209136 RepID=A0AAD9ZGF7_9LECA|nr:hypothetical protein OEA41_007507 [Lepraria neglecta]
MVRCDAWPIGSSSREALIFIKPSIHDLDFAHLLNNMFKIIDEGGAINETKARWINLNLFTHPGAIDIRAEVAREVGISNPPSMKQVIKILGAIMNGIFDLKV